MKRNVRSKPKPRSKAAVKKAAAKPAAAKKTAAKAPEEDPIEALVIAGAHALALPVEPAWRADVVLNLRLIFRHAALVDEFVLPDDAEPAPIFRA